MDRTPSTPTQTRMPTGGGAPSVSGLQRHGKHFLLYLILGVVALALFLVGWATAPSDPRLSQVLTNLGIALGPVAFLGAIYEWFLFDEIREGARVAFSEEIGPFLAPVFDKLKEHCDELKESSYVLAQIHKLGILAAYPERRDAFSILKDRMRHEEEEIFLIGTSLRGLLDEEVGDRDFQEILKDKFAAVERGESRIRVKILLTHPAFAYLRQDLEKLQSRREDFSIAQEIYFAVRDLKRFGARPTNIQFVKGTPTCFGVKTSSRMLLNPYPYQDQALGSFCLVVSNETNRDEIYRRFDRAHFIWDSPNTEVLEGFSVRDLEKVFGKQLQDLMPSPAAVQVRGADFDS